MRCPVCKQDCIRTQTIDHVVKDTNGNLMDKKILMYVHEEKQLILMGMPYNVVKKRCIKVKGE